MTGQVISPCTHFFVHLDSTGSPIPGTQFSKKSSFKKDRGYNCREAILPPYQMTVPAGQVRCFHSNHLRYFYRINPITGNILANSLFSQIGKPKSMCGILEYIVTKLA